MAEQDKLGEAVLVLSTQAKELIDGISNAKKEAEGLQSHFSKVGAALKTALGLAGIAIGLKEALQSVTHATIESEDAQANLASAVQSTGMAAGFSARQLKAQALALQEASRFSDEAIMRMQSALLAFGNIRGDVFVKTERAVLNFASATGRDASDAARTLGLALNDPAQGMSMLRRAGISLDGALKEQIKTMAENGRVSQAQLLLLQALEKSYGGRMTASVNTLGGAIDQLKNKFGDLFLELNGPTSAALVQFIQLVTRNLPVMAGIFNAVIGGIVEGLRVVAENFRLVGKGIGDLLARDAVAALKKFGEAGVNAATLPAQQMLAAKNAFQETQAAIGKMAQEMAAASKPAKNLGGDIAVASERGLAAAKAAQDAVFSAQLGITNATSQSLVTAGMDFDQLIIRAQEFALQADLIRQTAESQAQAGMTLTAEASARLAEQAAQNSQKFSQAAVAQNQRLASSFQGLKESGAASIGSLVGALAVGAISAEQFIRRLILAIVELIAKLLVLKAFGFGLGGSFGGGVISGVFGGLKAEGGPVKGGKGYIVGENGPELFLPDRSGTIIPNDKMAAGSGVTINQNFNLTGMDFGSADAARRFLQTAAAQMRAGAVEALGFARAAADGAALNPRRAF